MLAVHIIQLNLSVTETIGTPDIVLCMEVSLNERLNSTVMHYNGMRTCVLNREMSFAQRVLNGEISLLHEAWCIKWTHWKVQDW